LNAALAASLNRMADVSVEDVQSPRSTTFGLYASVRQRWRKLEAELGTRLDHQDYRGFASHSQQSPRINLRFDPTPVWHVYGSWGHFRQAQRVGEWRAEQPQTNPDPATHVVGVITGVAHDSSAATHWRLELYENHWLSVHPYFDNALNRLSLIPELGLDRVLITARSGESRGLEASVHHDFAEHWVVSGSYTLSRATDDLVVEDVLRSWDQTHAFNGNLTWQRALTSASLVIGWHTGWPKTPVSYLPATAMTGAAAAVTSPAGTGAAAAVTSPAGTPCIAGRPRDWSRGSGDVPSGDSLASGSRLVATSAVGRTESTTGCALIQALRSATAGRSVGS